MKRPSAVSLVRIPTPRGRSQKEPPIVVLHETSQYVVIAKPSGLDCQNSKPSRPSVAEWLKKKYDFVGLVHRLDFGTSGVMVCAKNSKSAHILTEKLKAGDIRRVYRALALGRNLSEQGAFTLPIDDQEATTNFRVLERFPNAVLLELELETGRKHQIRRHLFEAKHPVLGDHLYRLKGSHLLMKRPALHSYRLQIDKESYVATLPDDFRDLLQKLRSR